MRKVMYGDKLIPYKFVLKDGLKSHYISVARDEGVILKGAALEDRIADQLVLKKARWILDKLNLVRSVDHGKIVTGCRKSYLGRKYYVELIESTKASGIKIEFNASKFKVIAPKLLLLDQSALETSFENFMREKAKQKITPRVQRLSAEIGLPFNRLKFMKLEKRWGSCTPSNNIIINIEAVKLPYSLIDYLIIHELVHTQIKNHSKAFWQEVSRYVSNWYELDKRINKIEI